MQTGTWQQFFTTPNNKILRNLLFLGIFGWMCFYPIYTAYYRAYAVDHYLRHLDHIAGHSWFFNPWQYRVLSPWIIEVIYWIFDHTLFAVVHIQSIDLGVPGDQADKNETTRKLIEHLKDPEFIKYTIVFLFFRMVQNMLILWLAFKYMKHFIKNELVILLGLMMAVLFMGNSVVDSDFTFNTYMDVTFYLLTALVIVKKYNPLWVIPITFFAALNRETSIFIPWIFFFGFVSWQEWPNIGGLIKTNFKIIAITAVCTVIFFAIFFGVRSYYGYQPLETWRVPAGLPMLKFNLLSSVALKTYMEAYGVFGFLPFWALLVFRNMSMQLKVLFLSLIPIWFALHFTSGIAYQTRLFLVPTLLVFLPAVLESLERSYTGTTLQPSNGNS
ncbi:MAG TPA: hypothetical protein VFE50_02810 [Cyclobacteriaceae bacterium]|nr:hypothetical protein [Cyclobacteriaceae bacterium]